MYTMVSFKVRSEKKAEFTLTLAFMERLRLILHSTATDRLSVCRCNYLKCGHLSALFCCRKRSRHSIEKEKNNSIMFMEVYNN